MEYGVMDIPRPQEKFLYEILYLISKKKKKTRRRRRRKRNTPREKKKCFMRGCDY
jgi:hypothetical protein